MSDLRLPGAPPSLVLCLALAVGALGVALSGCERDAGPTLAGDSSGAVPSRSAAVRFASGETDVDADSARDGKRTWALLINGGGEPERNYQSHLLHLNGLIDLLLDGGVAAERMAVFASDGTDPSPDLAVLASHEQEDFWLIEGMRVAAALRPKVQLTDSWISGEGVDVYPATRAALWKWIRTNSSKIAPGDAVLVFVTDHGRKNAADLTNNAIVLWNEALSVDEYRQMAGAFAPGVRVVALMSQCFSGGFAYASYRDGSTDSPSGDVCGYFASTADRFAYGCYPENLGRENVGYAFRLIEALRANVRLPDAHERTLLTDSTPDVPHRSSDHYLEHLLGKAAGQQSLAFGTLVEAMLERAWADEIHYREDIAAIDRIGEVYGSFSPRSLAGLESRMANLPVLSADLREYQRTWSRASSAARRENFRRFLQSSPHWREAAEIEFLETLAPEQKRELLGWLLADLAQFTRDNPAVRKRLKLLHTMSREAGDAAYRMEVREGAALRMRTRLVRIAGRAFLDRFGSDDERASYERLVACEDLAPIDRVPGPRTRGGSVVRYPPLAEEMKILATLVPGWIGAECSAAEYKTRLIHNLAPGAVRVDRVYDGSPAERAGLLVGDVVLGPANAHFTERDAFREWVATSLIDEVRTVEVLRGEERIEVNLRVDAPPP